MHWSCSVEGESWPSPTPTSLCHCVSCSYVWPTLRFSTKKWINFLVYYARATLHTREQVVSSSSHLVPEIELLKKGGTFKKAEHLSWWRKTASSGWVKPIDVNLNEADKRSSCSSRGCLLSARDTAICWAAPILKVRRVDYVTPDGKKMPLFILKGRRRHFVACLITRESFVISELIHLLCCCANSP